MVKNTVFINRKRHFTKKDCKITITTPKKYFFNKSFSYPNYLFIRKIY